MAADRATGQTFYRRTQIAWPVIAPLVLVSAIVLGTFTRQEFVLGAWLFSAIAVVVLLLFSTMTVTVTNDGVLASFGIGLVRKRVSFDEVTSFARARNTWLDGWGVHAYPGGTLYNASGLVGIEFRLSSGRFVCIGTGDPDALAAALQMATGKAEAAHEAVGRRGWAGRHTAAAAVGVLALAGLAWTFYAGFRSPAVKITADAFSVSNWIYHDTIPFASIRTATLESTFPRIERKTNGFDAGDTLRGNFLLEFWGLSRLYINRDSPLFLVIRTAENKYILVNFKDPGRTRELYTDLTAHIDRAHR